VKVFDRHELTADMVMASAALPTLFQAVEIDGTPYWDGGYVGNPVLYPFFYECASNDIVIVQINPISRPGTPRRAREILNRINEITFNNSLLKEFRAIDFVYRLLDEGRLDASEYKHVLIHIVAGGADFARLSASSKMNAEWPFLQHLFAIGRQATESWLEGHYGDIGTRSSIDIRRLFQAGERTETGCVEEGVAP